jgi:hypothetical protein
MCTVSFLPVEKGFCLAMNRDEKRSRVRGLAPEIFFVGARRAIYPREPDGGTWVGINDSKLCLALINWHRVTHEPLDKIESRGAIIPHLIGASSSHAIERRLRRMTLKNVRPFRLIVVDGNKRQLVECQWDLKILRLARHSWKRRHWFSSGFDEIKAEAERTKVCDDWNLQDAIHIRKLHSSHIPARGPFSICMHRPDALTVSYTEIVVSEATITMAYKAGPACRRGATRKQRIQL